MASWGELTSESLLRIVIDSTLGSTFTLEDRGIWLVELGDLRDVTNSVDAAMVDSLRPCNLNLPGLNSQCLPSPLHTGIWPIVWVISPDTESKTSLSMYSKAMFNWNCLMEMRLGDHHHLLRLLQNSCKMVLCLQKPFYTESKTRWCAVQRTRHIYKLLDYDGFSELYNRHLYPLQL
jgi:hypothetical protein